MAAAIAVAVALAATAAAMRRGCLSGSDSGNGRRRREGGQAWRGVGAGRGWGQHWGVRFLFELPRARRPGCQKRKAMARAPSSLPWA